MMFLSVRLEQNVRTPSGIFSSDELNVLRDVLQEHCRENGISDKDKQDAIAQRILTLSQSGIADKEALKAALTDPLLRKP